MVGVTTNPTIFAKAITGSDAYDAQIRDLAARGVDVGEALRALTTFDVRWACDVLRPVYDATDGVDGRVSIEVDPRLAHDTEATIAEARALWWVVDRPNLFIKIPAARQGLPAITACLAEGISINVTLIFSLARYDEVIGRLPRRAWNGPAQAGHDLSGIGSVASFFVSRVDTEIDARLDKIGTARGRRAARPGGDRERPAGLPALRAGVRLTAVAGAGARPGPGRNGRCGPPPRSRTPPTPTPATSIDLVAPGVVNTMPEATLRAVADHGQVPADSIRAHYDESQQVLDRLAAARHRLRRRRADPRRRRPWPSSTPAGTSSASSWPPPCAAQPAPAPEGA